MSKSARLQWVIGIILAFALVIGLSVYLTSVRNENRAAAAAAETGPALLTDQTHLLTSSADDAVTLIEFLDFECESCEALHPTIERIKSEYDGRITMGVRYFPLPSHTNADLAARTVESRSAPGHVHRDVSAHVRHPSTVG